MTPETSQAGDDTEGSNVLLRQLAHSLHELCQPLTALQCRLEIDQMEHEGAEPTSRNRTITECLRECERLNATVNTMRTLLRQAFAKQETPG